MSSAHNDRLPPTDLELMMLADGELDPGRRAEVEAYLADEDEGLAQGKLAGLRAVSAVVAQAGAWPERGGIDVVDGVFAALDRDVAPEPRVADRTGGATSPRGPSDRASAQNRPTLDGAASSRRSAPAAPANDNARLIFGLALGAAAAAAGLFVWGRGGDAPNDVQATRAPTVETAPGVGSVVAPEVAGTGEVAVPGATASPVASDEPRYGVEVASVDFGQRSGAIYYVPAGDAVPSSGAGGNGLAQAAVTTVVWLSDE